MLAARPPLSSACAQAKRMPALRRPLPMQPPLLVARRRLLRLYRLCRLRLRSFSVEVLSDRPMLAVAAPVSHPIDARIREGMLSVSRFHVNSGMSYSKLV